MGLFSYNCKCCGHPMLAPHATNHINAWMNQVVVISKKNAVLMTGSYDGYGRVGAGELGYPMKHTVYHEACWKHAGSPIAYKGASANATDQGHFFDEGAHDMVEPGVKAAPRRPRPTLGTTRLTCHKDGSVTYWAMYLSGWQRHVRTVPNDELAAMNERDRLRVIRHFTKHTAQYLN